MAVVTNICYAHCTPAAILECAPAFWKNGKLTTFLKLSISSGIAIDFSENFSMSIYPTQAVYWLVVNRRMQIFNFKFFNITDGTCLRKPASDSFYVCLFCSLVLVHTGRRLGESAPPLFPTDYGFMMEITENKYECWQWIFHFNHSPLIVIKYNLTDSMKI